MCYFFFFFFKQKTAYEMRISDWSSDVCSSDLPYRHSTIGSMADLDAASLEDVRSWFRAHYGPNNAVLVLAGDIDAEAARPLVEKYFGDIPRGPEQPPVTAPVPTLSAPVDEIGSPSCRERVCQSVSLSGVAES